MGLARVEEPGDLADPGGVVPGQQHGQLRVVLPVHVDRLDTCAHTGCGIAW